MKPNNNFLAKPSEFWALVKYASEALGYSDRKRKTLKSYKIKELEKLGKENNLDQAISSQVFEYMNYRSQIISNEVKPNLMNRDEAEKVFDELLSKYKPNCTLPMNKQKKEKKHYSYFTCIINILTEHYLKKRGMDFDDNPGKLATIFDKHGKLIQTLSRRIDGAFPNLRNPKAIWEIKEYYGTTTFGSRVADGVYETQLDGYEIMEASKKTSERIKHYLFVDDKFTWWDKGRSYLCRLIDIVHIGLVDEVIFGKEVFERWPDIMQEWT